MSLDVELTTLTQEAARNDITANEYLKVLNALMRRGVTDRTNTPPAFVAGRVYIITASPTGQWLADGRSEHDLAIALDAKWVYATPTEGWLMRVQDENAFYLFDGSTWVQQTALDMVIAAALADVAALTSATITGSITGASTDQAIEDLTDPADTPADADALRDDLVANLIPELRNNLAELQEQLNALRVDVSAIRSGHNTLLANRRTANEQSP